MPEKTDLEWWKTSIIYQIYPRSFCDTSGDGIGDLKGVTSKLDYLKYLKVGAVWLSPFYKSPMKDFGYDVSDFCEVDPMFGTLQDFDELVQEAHKRDLKIIVDFVPNHTSDQHNWFQKSCQRQTPYDNYYIWHDGKKDEHGNRQPPNNWDNSCEIILCDGPVIRASGLVKTSYKQLLKEEDNEKDNTSSGSATTHSNGAGDTFAGTQDQEGWKLSAFGGPAWCWHEGRGQYYYSVFLREQPDLNFRNPDVVKEMNDVVRFWLRRGVDGLRVDAVEQLFEAEDLRDEPRSYWHGVPPFQHDYLIHTCTRSQPEIEDMVREWRKVMEEFERKDGQHRFMVVETYQYPQMRNRFYSCGASPFNHDLVTSLKAPLSGHSIRALVEQEYAELPENGWPTFVLGNHDRQRVSDRYGPVYCDVLNMLLLTLRGTPCTYYGEELAMQEISVTFEQTQDPWGKNYGPDRYHEFSRDSVRSPMQWNASQHAGFTSGLTPWLPVHPSFETRNVKVQRASPKQTTLQMYAAIATLRQEPEFQKGELIFSVTNDNILSYVRQLPDDRTNRYLVVLNVGKYWTMNDFSNSPVNSERGVIVQSTCSVMDMPKDKEVCLWDLELGPGDGMIIKLL